MITHNDLGDKSIARTRQLKMLIDKGEVQLAGNIKLKIYGKLNCRSGKRMKAENRVFFKSKVEAKVNGYRPCGHCMHEEYLLWKASN